MEMKRIKGFVFFITTLVVLGCPNSSSDIPVTGISLNKDTTSVLVGGAEQLFAIVEPADATNQNVNWTSSDAGKATVSAAGLVTGVAAGM
jgi:uncharacterized protein YjdB